MSTISAAHLWRFALEKSTHRAAITLYLTLGAQGLALLATVLLAHALPLESYGHYLYATSWALLASQVVILGFDRLSIREVAANLARQDMATLHGFIRFVFKWSMGLAGLASLVVWVGGAASDHLRWWTKPEGFGWAMASVPLMVLLNLQIGVVRGTDQIVASQIPDKFIRPVLFLLLCLLLVLFVPGAETSTFLAAYVASYLLASFWAWGDIRRHIPELQPGIEPVQRPRLWLTSSMHLSTTVVMLAINSRADPLMLGLLSSPNHVAWYMVALRISQSGAFGLGVVNVMLGPNISRLHALGDQAGLKRLARRYAWATSLLGLFSMGILVVFRAQLVALFGADFSHASGPLLILCLGQFLATVSGPAGSFLVYCGREDRSAVILTICCVVNIALNFLLIPKYGASGAAWSGCLSLVLKNFMLVRCCLRDLKLNPTPIPFRV